ncbi:Rieske 2Fe-2S domain-containing protein [Flavobacteriaceae bacterium]|nr:Rieske 2Fe-2S domain-containing protein [Flavobacteriaceae bacterium]
MVNKRRYFLKTACAPVVMTVLGIPMIEACSTDEEGSGIDYNNNDNGPINDTVTIDLLDTEFNVLENIGGWLNYTEEQMLLIRISDSEIRAFDNSCPHQGKRDGWSFNGEEFNCSHHDNSYSNSCNGSLTCYSSSLSENILTVTR